MTKLSDRLIRITLFATLIVGLITFLSSSASYAPGTFVSTDYTKSSVSDSKNNALTHEQLQQQQQLQEAEQIEESKAKGVPPNKEDVDTSKEKVSTGASSFADDSKVDTNKAAAAAAASAGTSGETSDSAKDHSSHSSSSSSKLPSSDTYVRQNATFVSLARNEDLWSLAEAVRSFQDRFNSKYNYDWVFLNNEEFSEEFKTLMTNLVTGKAKFGLIPKEHWSFPSWIDQDKAAKTREDMANAKIIYGDSISYRHMCRFESGFFYRHELMQNYQYYWRVEPSTKLHCDVDYDVFKFMKDEKKDYGFTISMHEFKSTIETLWASTKEFITENSKYLDKNNMMDFVSTDNGETYNLCHFWTNFEVGNMDIWRGEAYSKYFDFLDKKGGFFYERWGDAPVHSIAAALFLPRDRIHFFQEIGYFHGPYNNCPIDDAVRAKQRCMCNPNDDFTWQDYSCTRRFFDVNGMEKPKGWEKHTG